MSNTTQECPFTPEQIQWLSDNLKVYVYTESVGPSNYGNTPAHIESTANVYLAGNLISSSKD